MDRGEAQTMNDDVKPTLSIVGSLLAPRARFFTLFRPDPVNIFNDTNSLRLTSDNWNAQIIWADSGHKTCPLQYAVFDGSRKDSLEFTSCISC